MRINLRWKILVFTAMVPVALAIGTLLVVNRTVSSHLDDNIRESLRRSSRVFENMVAARARALEVAAQVIVRDPRFFSMAMSSRLRKTRALNTGPPFAVWHGTFSRSPIATYSKSSTGTAG